MSADIRHRFMRRSNTDVLLPQTVRDAAANPKPILPVLPTHKRVFGLPRRLLSWLYSISLGIFLLVFIALNAAVPIDAIVQSSGNLAFNTLVVLITCCIFIVVSLLLYTVRVFILRLNLQDIPKLYVPDHPNDMPLSAYNHIQMNLLKSQNIMRHAMPQQTVRHPDLYHNPHAHEKAADELPDFLVYEDVIKGFAEGLRLQSSGARAPKNSTYAEMLRYLATNRILDIDSRYLGDFLSLYGRLRFGGRPITEDDFFRVMELFVRAANVTAKPAPASSVSGSASPMQDYRRKSSTYALSRVTTTSSVVVRGVRGSAAESAPAPFAGPHDVHGPSASEIAAVDAEFNEQYGSASGSRSTSVAHSIEFPKFAPLSDAAHGDSDDDFYSPMKVRRYRSANSGSLPQLGVVPSNASESSADTARFLPEG